MIFSHHTCFYASTTCQLTPSYVLPVGTISISRPSIMYRTKDWITLQVRRKCTHRTKDLVASDSSAVLTSQLHWLDYGELKWTSRRFSSGFQVRVFVDRQILTSRINDSYRLIFVCLMTLFELYRMRSNVMKHGEYCKKKNISISIWLLYYSLKTREKGLD